MVLYKINLLSIHAQVYSETHKQIYLFWLRNLHACIFVHTSTTNHAVINSDIHTDTHPQIQTCAHRHVRAHTHNTYTHMHTNTHTFAQKYVDTTHAHKLFMSALKTCIFSLNFSHLKNIQTHLLRPKLWELFPVGGSHKATGQVFLRNPQLKEMATFLIYHNFFLVILVTSHHSFTDRCFTPLLSDIYFNLVYQCLHSFN